MEETKSTTNQPATYQQLLFLVIKGKITGLIQLGKRLDNCRISLYFFRDRFLTHYDSIANPIYNSVDSTAIKYAKQNCEELKISSFEGGLKYVLKAINETDIHKKECFGKLCLCCHVLALKCIPKPQKKDLLQFFLYEEIIRCKASEAIGYWTAQLEKRIAYASNQGANSKELGDMSIKEAKKILEKIGGITSYDALGYGKKKPITDEIEKKLKLKDKRHVYNILKKIKADTQDD